MSNAAKFSATEVITLDAFHYLLHNPMLAEERSVVSGCPYLVVDLNQPPPDGVLISTQGTDKWRPNTIVIGVSSVPVNALAEPTQALLPFIDVIADGTTPEFLLDAALINIARRPIASTALIQVLRHSLSVSVEQALILESLTYSSLQHGAEFLRWLKPKDVKAPDKPPGKDIDQTVLSERSSNHLTVTLNRPTKHNAFSASMREGLTEALLLASTDMSIEQVTLQGAGPSFCAGGDLEEFGEARDAAIAHLTRTTRSPGRLIYTLRDKITVNLHGACIGAGIEMTAFAERVIARPDALFALPEVGFGLVPGAGGTVSIPRRIGPHRTALLGLSGQRIDCAIALSWGLIDAIE